MLQEKPSPYKAVPLGRVPLELHQTTAPPSIFGQVQAGHEPVSGMASKSLDRARWAIGFPQPAEPSMTTNLMVARSKAVSGRGALKDY